MMRRPPGHAAPQRKLLLALALLVLPGIVDAQQQQQHGSQGDQRRHRQEVSQQIDDHARQQPLAAAAAFLDKSDHPDAANAYLDDSSFVNRKAAAAGAKIKSPAEGDAYVARLSVETPPVPRKRTSSSSPSPRDRHAQHDDIQLPPLQDESTVSTSAPDLSVRAPLPLDRAVTPAGYGIVSPQSARSLDDWVVEDFVLLATVDGALYATDKTTGRLLWHTQTDKPVVEITHHRAGVSTLDDGYHPIDHYIWAIEPNRDGSIYILTPDGSASRLINSSLTVKSLVDNSPVSDTRAKIVYTGRKESTVVTLDAATGKVHSWFGAADPDANFQNNQPECLKPSGFDGATECPVSGTVTLGRTDYIVYVSRTDVTDRPRIATLKYSEWGPNNFDRDLHSQYHSTPDDLYITSSPDGQVYFVGSDRSQDSMKELDKALAAPICRVFDIRRPSSYPPGTNPELLVLPQPLPPAKNAEAARMRSEAVFMDQTEGGSWYALSGLAYPLVLAAPDAPCTNKGFWERNKELDQAQLHRALVGKHALANPRTRSTLKHDLKTLPGIEGGSRAGNSFERDPENTSVPTLPPTNTDTPPTVVGRVKDIPQAAATSLIDLWKNPVFLLLLGVLVVWNHKEFRRQYNKQKRWFYQWIYHEAVEADIQKKQFVPPEQISEQGLQRDGQQEPPVEAPPPPAPPAETTTTTQPGAETEEHSVRPADPLVEGAPAADEVVVPAETAESGETGETGDTGETGEAGADGPPEQVRKKTRARGRRAGARHRKAKNKREPSVSVGDDDGPGTVDDAVDRAMGIGDVPRQLEPDVRTIPSDVQEISGPIVRVGSFEVDENKQLGTGSNGTVVFAGKFDGRDVAVKRMLIQFYDIASQETRLLRESDDHRNVIRYYAQQKADAFLYIALELCQASLAEIVERPQLHRDLAAAGAADLGGVLYQITNGLNHLHSLRIVHRDLKPQNILVNMERDGKPRLLVSDFGLCKKLEGGQSSFGATTAHAAGTSGWRAPELLLDDDVRDTGTTLIDASSAHSGSGSVGNPDGSSSRRATRAIDIFSLGLVFYYCLTQGRHPFDCGDRYMREVNIRKGNYNLDALDIVESAFEAKDLIKSMLNSNPKMRPNTEGVMAHPFFWPAKKRLNFLCDVSDHFEKEPRDPPSEPLQKLESYAPSVCRGDFLKRLPKDFVESLGKQRKYTGTRLLDLLRALRNKRNHYEDMPDALKAKVGSLPEGYVKFWMDLFPNLLISCWDIGWSENWMETDRFHEYYVPTFAI